MKKIIAALLVLALAAPALATTVTATQIDCNSVKISYSGGTPVPRGFGIDVKLDNENTFEEPATGLNQWFWVSFSTCKWIETSGALSNPFVQDPVADDDSHPDTLPGYDSNGVTLEMGSLYGAKLGLARFTPKTTPPPTTGDLCTFTIHADFRTDPNISVLTMSDNTARGGIVLEGGGSGSTYNGTTLYLSTLNATDYATWLAWGGGNPANAPQNWRNCYWKYGDVNGDALLTVGDLVDLYGNLKPPSGVGLADWNMDGLETVGDLVDLYTAIKGPPSQIGPCSGPCP
jgi:hypothetical protein